jgi:hypothetical protein
MILAPMLLAAVVAGIYLVWDPASADLAAQTFRADLWSREGFAVWSNAWYSGHHLPGYSLLFPPLASLTSPQVVGAASAVVSAGLFGALANHAYGARARLGALWFAMAAATSLLTGRITFALGVALGLAALLAVQRRRCVVGAALGVLTAAASPVAGLFLAIAGAAVAIAQRREPKRGVRVAGVATALGALAAIAGMVLAFPVDGVEPFVFSAFWSVPIVCAVALLLLPGDERVLRWGVGLYALAVLALFVFDTAVGGNATRLGALFAGPVMALALAGRRPLALALIAVPLLVWQWSPAVRDVADADGDPSVDRAFHTPLLEELDSLTVGAPTRVQLLPTRNRWEAVHVAPEVPLARGWLRQAESNDFDLFEGNLTPDAYLEWLRERAVSYVAVPLGVELDYLAEDEAALIDAGLPYLDLVWESPEWRLYAVTEQAPFVSTPEAPLEPTADARLAALGPDSFELTADDPGSYLVRVHYTRYWNVVEGMACVAPEGEWTRVDVQVPSVVHVKAEFGLDALFGTRDGC